MHVLYGFDIKLKGHELDLPCMQQQQIGQPKHRRLSLHESALEQARQQRSSNAQIININGCCYRHENCKCRDGHACHPDFLMIRPDQAPRPDGVPSPLLPLAAGTTGGPEHNGHSL